LARHVQAAPGVAIAVSGTFIDYRLTPGSMKCGGSHERVAWAGPMRLMVLSHL